MSATEQIDPTTTTIGQLARRFPAATRVLERLRIDYCCGGDRHLAIACADAGISVAELLDQVLREQQLDRGQEPDWEACALPDLCRHIVLRFHEPLRRELPALRMLAVRVATAHGERDPRLLELAGLVAETADEMDEHMAKEERVLFPMIAEGGYAFTAVPVACLRSEHVVHGERLERMAALTDGFTCPEDGCASWHALCERLRALAADLRAHVSLENNVLFPRAVEAVARLTPPARAFQSR